MLDEPENTRFSNPGDLRIVEMVVRDISKEIEKACDTPVHRDR